MSRVSRTGKFISKNEQMKDELICIDSYLQRVVSYVPVNHIGSKYEENKKKQKHIIENQVLSDLHRFEIPNWKGTIHPIQSKKKDTEYKEVIFCNTKSCDEDEIITSCTIEEDSDEFINLCSYYDFQFKANDEIITDMIVYYIIEEHDDDVSCDHEGYDEYDDDHECEFCEDCHVCIICKQIEIKIERTFVDNESLTYRKLVQKYTTKNRCIYKEGQLSHFVIEAKNDTDDSFIPANEIYLCYHEEINSFDEIQEVNDMVIKTQLNNDILYTRLFIHELFMNMVIVNEINKTSPHFMFTYGFYIGNKIILKKDNHITFECVYEEHDYVQNKNLKNIIYETKHMNRMNQNNYIVMCMEYIKGISFEEYRNAHPTFEDYLLIYIQVINGLNDANQVFIFTHNDMHDENIKIEELEEPVFIPIKMLHYTWYIKTKWLVKIYDYGQSTAYYRNSQNAKENKSKFYGFYYGIEGYEKFEYMPFLMGDAYKFLLMSANYDMYKNDKKWLKQCNIIYRYFGEYKHIIKRLKLKEKQENDNFMLQYNKIDCDFKEYYHHGLLLENMIQDFNPSFIHKKLTTKEKLNIIQL